MKIILIRHGFTAGNLEKRYIGSTDEPLCPEGVAALKRRSYPECDEVVCSPMRRCVRTAEIIYPGKKRILVPELRECDFGDFEGKNYAELAGNADYQSWIDSGGEAPFPNGESPADFRKRCAEAFEKIVAGYGDNSRIAFAVHGGTIMAILEKYAVPRKGYFEYARENGGGYVCELRGSALAITEEL